MFFYSIQPQLQLHPLHFYHYTCHLQPLYIRASHATATPHVCLVGVFGLVGLAHSARSGLMYKIASGAHTACPCSRLTHIDSTLM